MVRDIANMSRNSREVSQWCTSTAARCMSGSTAAPPPNASSDSTLNIAAICSSVAIIARAPRRATTRLAGSMTSSTSSSGIRRMPIPTMMAPAISAGPRRRMLLAGEPDAGRDIEPDSRRAGAGEARP